MQFKPSEGFVFLVVTRLFDSFRVPFISPFAVVFLSNCIRLSFTSLYSVSIQRNGVIMLYCDLGINVTGELFVFKKLDWSVVDQSGDCEEFQTIAVY